MDTPARPPHVVFEGRESCADPARAEGLLDQALGAASAPAPGWSLQMRIAETPQHALVAEGDIADATGRSVAHRTLRGAAGDCEGLARAMGVWAALVLDIERSHAGEPTSAATLPANSSPSPPAPADKASTAPGGEADRSPWPPAPADPSTAPGGDDDGPREAPVASAGTSPGPGWREDHRTLEAGVGTLLMDGTGSNAIVGGTLYGGIELVPGFLARPAIAIGEALTPAGNTASVNAQWFALRGDGCWRTPGTYMRNRGLELDLCGGVDAGLTHFDAGSGNGTPAAAKDLAEIAVGPSLDLQGELGSDLSVAIRGVAGVNVARGQIEDSSGNPVVRVPWLCGRLEVALSWRAR